MFVKLVPGSCSETRPALSHNGNEFIIIKVEEEVHIKEQEIPVAVGLPPVKAEHDYHSSMLHTPTASLSTLHYLSTSQL
jgi:hypothetical protein